MRKNGTSKIRKEPGSMESPEKFVRGSVKISVSGEQIERFLNLCRARGLLLENVRLPEEKKLTARISIADFKKLAPIHSKTHVRIHILEKRGLPFFLYKSWRRKYFSWASCCAPFCFSGFPAAFGTFTLTET